MSNNNFITNKFDLTFFIQCKNCNPNGDPDAGNLPRQDDETGKGYITDSSLKRQIRDYIQMAFRGVPNYEISITNGANLNIPIYEAVRKANGENVKLEKHQKVNEAASILCDRFFDIRAFGGVMSTGLNGGAIQGAVQFEVAESIDPIMTNDVSVTRMAYSEGKFETLEEYEKADANMPEDKKRTIGRKQFATYGLYKVNLHISPCLAEKTGFNEKDFNYLLEAISNMYTFKPSASKAGMCVVGPIILFKHVGKNVDGDPEDLKRETMLGCAPSYKLQNLIKVVKKDDVEVARDFTDYDATIETSKLPSGIQIGFKYDAFSDIIWDKLSNDDEWFKEV